MDAETGGSASAWWLGALALMLVFEGLLPLLNPRGWRDVMMRVARMSDGQIRFIGLASVLIGMCLLLLWT